MARIEIKAETLDEKAKRWKQAYKSGEMAPLLLAPEVLEVIDNWDQYKAQAKDVTVNAFLARAFGRAGLNVRFWRGRATAIVELETLLSGKPDGSIVRRLHHNVAVWVNESVPRDHRVALLWKLITKAREQGGLVVQSQASRIYFEMVGRKPKPRTPRVCNECERLTEELKKLKEMLVEHGITNNE